MKHPFWLVNSILLLLFLTMLGFIFFSKPKKIKKVHFIPEEVKPLKKVLPKIDLSKIYMNDLFDTFQEPVLPEKPIAPPKPLPEAPSAKQPQLPQRVAPQFLEPLKITLRGIMVTGNDETNVAVIEDNLTKKSQNYHLGDTIQDAQVIRLLKNKVILIRSNGQQETLYVNKHDAELEALLAPKKQWDSIVVKEDVDAYIIDPKAFVGYIRSLAQFIDMLSLTTVYRQGESIGCRVGSISKESLASALGLQSGDIIIKINNIPATDTKNRFEIYQQVIASNLGDSIAVNFLRHNLPFDLTYTLSGIKEESISAKKVQTEQKMYHEIEEEKKKLLQEQHKFAPTARELEKEHKQNIIEQNRKQALHTRRKYKNRLMDAV